MISTEAIKELRDQTGISVAECKKALEEANGDVAAALGVLKERSAAVAAKKGERNLGAGAVGSYVHATGSLGAMVVLHSETDFVAKNTEFKAAADDLALHLTAMAPTTREEFVAQPFVKNPDQTIDDVVKALIQKFGERIEIGAFARFDASATA